MSGFVSWWDFADRSTLTMSTDAISDIADKSGNGWTLTGAHPNQYPDQGGSLDFKIGPLRAAYFDSDDSLVNASFPNAAPISYVAVVANWGDGAFQALVGGAGGAQPEFRLSNSVPGNLQLVRSSSGVGVTFNISGRGADASLRSPYLVACCVSTTLTSVYRDRVWRKDQAHGQTLTGATGLALGAQSSAGGSGWRGLIGEMLVYPSYLTQTEVYRVFRYLARRWDLLNARHIAV